jgi:hypothetical protein
MNIPCPIRIADDDALLYAIRWEAPPLIWRNITGIARSAPARLTVPAHGVPDGWIVEVESARGMREINNRGWQKVTVIDADTIELNAVNALDFHPYHEGGVIKFNTPVDFTGMVFTARLKDRRGGEPFLTLTEGHGLTIRPELSRVDVLVTLEQLNDARRRKFVLDIDVVDSKGINIHLFSGDVARGKT